MESEFLQWLDSFPGHLGTILAVTIGGVGLITALVTSIMKLKKEYEQRIVDMTRKEETDRKFKDDISEMIREVKILKDNSEFLSQQYAETQRELNGKIDNLTVMMEETKQKDRDQDSMLETKMTELNTTMSDFRKDINANKDQLDVLIASDKESIKSFIVSCYYQAKSDGYVNSHLMQIIEERYETYKKENGNSYVGGLMNELRAFPHTAPN
jgi:hypothetical protein|nr:MAG TPA: hypothetical protein [Caudoviricetes sp.]